MSFILDRPSSSGRVTYTIIRDNSYTNGTTIITAGTYIPPVGCSFLKIRMLGGGGGGGTPSGNAGNAGDNSTFDSLLTAFGGNGGAYSGLLPATGGSFSISLPATGFGINGGSGQTAPGQTNTTGTVYLGGADGGNSVFGGAGYGGGWQSNHVGGNASPNSGGGGGGGGAGAGAANIYAGGGGGGAGGYVEATIPNPAASYSYHVANFASGINPTGPGGPTASGDGATGIIIIEEHSY